METSRIDQCKISSDDGRRGGLTSRAKLLRAMKTGFTTNTTYRSTDIYPFIALENVVVVRHSRNIRVRSTRYVESRCRLIKTDQHL
jgi:hypothetical protein